LSERREDDIVKALSDLRTGPLRHLHPNLRELATSPTIALNERSQELEQAGRRVYKLGFGQSPFPVPELVVATLRDNAFQKDYLPVRGHPALRAAFADYLARKFDLAASPDDVLVGPGTKELMFLLQFAYGGDLVLPTPSWVSYAPQARIAGSRVRLLATSAEDGWCLDPMQLDDLCRSEPGRPRFLVLNDPLNPTGTTYSPSRRSALAEVARRHGVLVFSDEIYGELDHAGEHRSFAEHYPEGTVVSTGLSKWAGAGGWRLGALLFPPELRWLREAVTVLASETYSSTTAPIQHAAVRAFAGGPEIEAYLERSRRVLGALGRWSANTLRDAGISVARPRASFYLFPDFGSLGAAMRARGIETGVQLCERLLEDTGVTLLQGSAFGRPDAELTARLAYVTFDGSAALAAVEALPAGESLDEGFLRAHCPETLEGVERIAEWVAG
jgi:aspartate aminotransferase